ncbi:MAG: alpha-amylase family glycosyl hydrolase [Phenylobacterium sp.]|uniref:alpha-amylase family glycosyl hydrolase n=1 Tax=Phenylobacterium sp. TaxID=1871053 RepID=UPI0027237655|nr:alpha-amylase family glycosyl hydrolase [Phenylobacterium sp.]MDO8914100.1 alpha-amylase family glycosyl hydrolase [Phenylobacterium sp.]MDP3102608.1 alpha-amylase family glycosyl hydrolase [Phenylobacterium sp.]
MSAAPWWKGAVVYHIYVRSFFDSDGDGHGDLAGVAAKLDYIKDLGVDAIWLSPVHPSPNRDWGYDVSDFEGVHPDYGSMADLEALVEAAHGRGLKVMLDEVLSHTSDEHAWFAASRDGGPDGEKASWYVWADPAQDGTAPNNWLSVFGGPAWAYQPARRQHYHHKFLRQQPKLNWRNPDAKEAAISVLDFWLAKGIDGFRLDVAGTFLHDDSLTDNPAVPAPERTRHHWAHASEMQVHLNDSNLPENIPLLDEIRTRVDGHGDRFVFGEFSEEEERCGAYCTPEDGLHSAYTFVLLHARKLNPQIFRDHFETLARHPGHWPCISFCNHDIMRTATRFGGGEQVARLMLALLLSLKGTTLLYQGEELGLPQAQSLTRTEIRDPVGDLYWPISKGRDGSRTPMPWAPGENLGFSSAKPWLPSAPEHRDLTVAAQAADPDSTLAFSKALIALRKASPALTRGEIEMLPAAGQVLAFTRTQGDERVLCLFNMGAEPAVFEQAGLAGDPVSLPGLIQAKAAPGRVELAPYAVAFIRRP